MAASLANDSFAPWLVIAKDKRRSQAQILEAFRRNFTASEKAWITDIDDVAALARRIADGELTAYDVTLAYVQR